MKDKEKEFDKAISKHHKLLAKEIGGESVPWNEVKDKPMKVALNLKTAVKLLRGFGADIEEIDGVYWIKINQPKKN